MAFESKETSLINLLKNLELARSNEVYLHYKKKDFNEDEKKHIIKNFLFNLVNQKQPSIFLNEYLKLSILKKIFPDLYRLTKTIHDPIFHPEKDNMGLNTVWGHTFISLDIAKKISILYNLNKNETMALLLGTLIHDIGKPEVTEWEFKRGRLVVSSILHDSKGVEIGKKFLKGLNINDSEEFPLKTIILNLIKYHHRVFELHRNRKSIKLNVMGKLKKDMLGYEKLLIFLDFADRQSRNEEPLKFNKLDSVSEWIIKKREEYMVLLAKPKPLIMGRDILALGMMPGRDIGKIIDKFYERQLKGEFSTKEEALIILKNDLKL